MVIHGSHSYAGGCHMKRAVRPPLGQYVLAVSFFFSEPVSSVPKEN